MDVSVSLDLIMCVSLDLSMCHGGDSRKLIMEVMDVRVSRIGYEHIME